MERAVGRLRLVAIVVAGVFFIAWFVPVTLGGDLIEEFQDVFQWLPPTMAIVSSALLAVACRSRSIAFRTLLTLGLAYEVLVSYAITISQYWGTFNGLPAWVVDRDIIGMAPVGVWMTFFTVLVPAEPRRTLVALLASASAVPVTYVVLVRANGAPATEAGNFFVTFVLPYLITVTCAYAAARVMYRLGQDVRVAREMGSYQLEELLGRGGMGEVWRASHRLLARPAAIKLIRQEVLGADAAAAEAATRRFKREAQVTASLRSPNTVELYDFGTADDGTLYYVMELLQGIDLDRMVREFGPLPPARAVFLLRQACASLAEAHSRRLIHRDVKPANLYVCHQGLEYDLLKVLDFGLVRLTGSLQADPAQSQTVGLVGTPSYMAPEMAAGGDIDGRADLYALGCVAYWLLTGQPVFDGGSVAEIVAAHLTRMPDPPSVGAPHPVSAELDAIVLRCLAKDRNDRFPDALSLRSALSDAVVDRPWTVEDAATWWTEKLDGEGATRGDPADTVEIETSV
jgi:eukaryotic-like serine/threonine-protein kinase